MRIAMERHSNENTSQEQASTRKETQACLSEGHGQFAREQDLPPALVIFAHSRAQLERQPRSDLDLPVVSTASV